MQVLYYSFSLHASNSKIMRTVYCYNKQQKLYIRYAQKYAQLYLERTQLAKSCPVLASEALQGASLEDGHTLVEGQNSIQWE